MKATLIAAALLTATAVSAASAQAVAEPPPAAVAKREHIAVSSAHLRLGDIFANIGDAAGAIVAKAPSVGTPLVLDAPTLERLARAHGLAWRPRSMAEQAIIERQSRIVEAAEISALIEPVLRDKGLGDEPVSIEVAVGGGTIRVPADARLLVESLSFAAAGSATGGLAGRRFTATLVAAVDGAPAQRFAVTGQVFRMVQVPVLIREVRRGEVIGERDLGWIDVRDHRLPANAVVDADALVGLTPRRPLKPGTPIPVSDLRRPVLVAKGSLVTLTLMTPTMTLTARGRALEDGGEADLVRIANLNSNSVVEGMVTGAGQATVATGSPSADRKRGRL
jgi:flagella basal body P-ring formation protein FlgA